MGSKQPNPISGQNFSLNEKAVCSSLHLETWMLKLNKRLFVEAFYINNKSIEVVDRETQKETGRQAGRDGGEIWFL